MVPSWSTTTRMLVLVAFLAAGLYLAARIETVLEVVVIAGLLAYLLHPAADRLAQRTRLGYAGAARLVYGLFLLLLVAIPATLGTVAITQLSQYLGRELTAIAAVIETWLAQPVNILGYVVRPIEVLNETAQSLAALLVPVPARSIGWVSAISTNLLWLVLVFVGAYYFLKDGPGLKPWLLSWVPEEARPEIDRLIEQIDAIWRIFLRVQILIFFILAALMALGTLGVIWLFRSGLLAFSPIVLIILLVVVYSAVQQVDNLWLRPRWMGRHLNLHPGLVIAGLIAALAVGGVLGALLIVPLMGTAKVVGGYLYRKLLDLPPWPEEQNTAAADEQAEEIEFEQEEEA